MEISDFSPVCINIIWGFNLLVASSKRNTFHFFYLIHPKQLSLPFDSTLYETLMTNSYIRYHISMHFLSPNYLPSIFHNPLSSTFILSNTKRIPSHLSFNFGRRKFFMNGVFSFSSFFSRHETSRQCEHPAICAQLLTINFHFHLQNDNVASNNNFSDCFWRHFTFARYSLSTKFESFITHNIAGFSHFKMYPDNDTKNKWTVLF